MEIDLSVIDDVDDSQEDNTYDPTDYGYDMTISHCGNSITYYTWHTRPIDDVLQENVSYVIYRNILNTIVGMHVNRLRNVVVVIRYIYDRAFISITRKRLLSLDADINRAFNLILDSIIQRNYMEVYEHYEGNYDRFNSRYISNDKIDMGMFSLDTSQFSIAVSTEPSGGNRVSVIL